MASANLYDGLINVDPKGSLVPELAEKWEVSPDATKATPNSLRPASLFNSHEPLECELRRSPSSYRWVCLTFRAVWFDLRLRR